MSSVSSNGYEEALDLTLTLAVNGASKPRPRNPPPPPPPFHAVPNPNPNQMVPVPPIWYGYSRLPPAIAMMPRYLPNCHSPNPNSNFAPAACPRSLSGSCLQLQAILKEYKNLCEKENQTTLAAAIGEDQLGDESDHESSLSSSSINGEKKMKMKMEEEEEGARGKHGNTGKLPIVSAEGSGEGRKIHGMLFKYKGKITIACCCHGTMFSPREFVLHAGGVPGIFPMRQITMEKN